MKRILVSISGNAAQMQSAIAEAMAIYREESVAIHLLNLQALIPSYAARFFKGSDLHAMQKEAGMEELAPARAILDAAGIPYTVHVETGRSAESIVCAARELGCDRIVMGQAGHPDVTEKLFGTLASQVRHLVGVAGNCKVIGS